MGWPARDPGGLSRVDLLLVAARDQAGARRGAGTRPDCGSGPGHGGAWTRPSAPRRGHRRSPAAGLWTAAPRPRRTGHRSGRSCSCPRPAAAGPARPAWAARQGPARRPPPAAGPGAGPARRRPRPPRSAPASPQPTRPASPSGRRRRGPAAHPAVLPLRLSPPPCGSLVRVHADHYNCHQHAPAHRHQQWGTWRACLITDSLSLVPLSSHATARPGGLAPRYRARPLTRSAGGSGASPPDLTNATAQPQRPQTQLGGLARVSSTPPSLNVTPSVTTPPIDIGAATIAWRLACYSRGRRVLVAA
jgi:hypothetical protein